MLHRMNDFKGCAILASDGNIGRVNDFTFDDKAWVIRYLVVDAGTWLDGRQVLISSIGIDTPNWQEKTIPVAITKEQIKNSPAYDGQKPVTKQIEIENLSYYNYPYYWGGVSHWGNDTYPTRFGTGSGSFNTPPFELHSPETETETETEDMEVEAHQANELRSCNRLIGYRVAGNDGDIGLVKDLLIDVVSWAIRYLVVDTGEWWHAQQILIAPQWIGSMSWSAVTISLNMSRQDAKDAPYYDPSVKIDRQLEAELHEHYGQPFYWVVKEERAQQLT